MPKLRFKGPTYWSSGDEDAFFYWLERIPGVTKVTGELRDQIVHFSRKPSRRAQAELSALFRRYGIEKHAFS